MTKRAPRTKQPPRPLDPRSLERVTGGGDTTKTPFNRTTAEDDWESPAA